MEHLKVRLEKVILKHFTRSSVHGLNNSVIPAKKLENVKALHNIREEEILYIYDATLFGSARDGMVFTNKGIYWREVLESPGSIDYGELIESTANMDMRAGNLFTLGREEAINLKEIYYKLICDLRADLIKSSIIYETYYKTALASATESLGKLLERKQYGQITEWLSKYEGLFLQPKHKSVKIREISFQAYLQEKMYPKANEQLKHIEEKNPRFYSKAAPLLERALKEERYTNLESRRLKAIEEEDFDGANLLLEKQKSLNIRRDIQIDRLRTLMEESKIEALKNHLEQVNIFLREERFAEAEQAKARIYQIDPDYPLEREKILLSIYQYDLKKAKDEIAQLSDPALKLELEKIRQEIIKKLNERIRNAARNKQYEIFEKRPEIWNYTDEYAMSPLFYFALEADLEGVLKALDHTDILLMPANIFGHNFVDLICLACDPDIGNKKENPLDLLKKLKGKVDLQQIDDRIRFLETGQERHFFSYKLLQENKLTDLSQTLIMPEFFKLILIEIENQTYGNVNKIIRHMFSRELEGMDTYPQKDEFETSDDYRRRAKEFRRQYLNRFDFIEEYKRQNQATADGVEKILKEKKTCFIPRITALVEYKGKDLEALRSLEDQGNVLRLLDFYFPADDDVKSVDIGMYDADRQVFLMRVDKEIVELAMPLAIAREYRKTFDEVEFVRRRVIKDGKVVMGTVPRYNQ